MQHIFVEALFVQLSPAKHGWEHASLPHTLVRLSNMEELMTSSQQPARGWWGGVVPSCRARWTLRRCCSDPKWMNAEGHLTLMIICSSAFDPLLIEAILENALAERVHLCGVVIGTHPCYVVHVVKCSQQLPKQKWCQHEHPLQSDRIE